MKVRLGFVSNSSSSSFCICGIRLCDAGELFDVDLDDDDSTEKMQKELKSLCKGTDLDFAFSYEDADYIHLGLPIEAMNDDETKEQFFDRAQKQIEQVLTEKKLEVKVEGVSLRYGEISGMVSINDNYY